jgi:predicted DNA-binding transcriptional regulator AlpA
MLLPKGASAMQPTTLNQPERLLSRKEAATFLGVSVSCLANWACTKRQPLPYVKLGNMVRYRMRDLEAFVTEQMVLKN